MRARDYCANRSIRDHLLGTEMHEQMSRSGGQSEARPPVFKSPSKLSTHLSIHCSRDESSSPGGATAYQLPPRSINRQVANGITKNDANLALSPTFRYVSIELPL
ncbi:hypothetical protein TNCV_814001 [Trichonephila clavipes]|nr:hypothetical protein TNCV_814001 [Trichonephila clavipes]